MAGKSSAGKGDGRRPMSVPYKIWEQKYDRIFRQPMGTAMAEMPDNSDQSSDTSVRINRRKNVFAGGV